MNRKKTIVGYDVRRKDNDGIRLCCLSLAEAKRNCPYGCAVWSTYRKTYGIRLKFFWYHRSRKIGYDKYSNVFHLFNLHVGWELMKRTVPIEIVYEPQDEPASGE